MIKPKQLLALGWLLAVALWCGCGKRVSANEGKQTGEWTKDAPRTNIVKQMSEGVNMTDAEWKRVLSPEQYRILREKGTERAFSGNYWNHKAEGIYRCAGCGLELFESGAKFDSGCGWPSFYAPADTNVVSTKDDYSHFMHRTEVLCSACGGHLGHVFNDGPQPTGLRYCINSASLKFDGKNQLKDRPKQK
jgi:peptide-methionine (R)-S-oxide reductase